MNKHLKLSLWDAFAFFLSGWAVCVSIYMHSKYIGLDINAQLGALSPTALGFASFLAPLLIGLMFEPVGNLVGDFALKLSSEIKRLMKAIRNWLKPKLVEPNDFLVAHVKGSIPPSLSDAVKPYHWAKDYLSQEQIETPYMEFLSKFGFYRNLGVLLLVNALLIPYLHGFGKNEKIVFCGLLGAALLYFVRSQRFYRHMGETVFRNYAILLERKSKESREAEKR